LRESLKQLDLFGSSEKMSVDTLPLDSQLFIKAYEIWVTQLRQDCLRRQSVVRHKSENGSLSWPTMAMGTHERGGYAHKGVYEALRKGEKPKVQVLLVDRIMVEEEVNWPTLQHSEYKGQSQRGQHKPDDRLTNKVISGLLDQDSPNTNGKSRGLWVSIQARDWKGRQGQSYKGLATDLPEQIKGKLNPDWVEQLMGLIVGWTDCDC